MRIKMVCELTGLTDRTVRYYIDEQLISPAFTENYLGRKTFTFTEQDVDQLNHIAVLRKFDFSIEEIRELLAHPERSGRIINNVKSRIEATVAQGEATLQALSQLSISRPYTVAELARALLMPVDTIPMKNEHKPVDIGGVLLKGFVSVFLFLITWSPIVFVIRNCFYSCWFYEHPHVSWQSVFFCLLFLWPSILLLFLHRFKFSRKTWKRRVAKLILYHFCFWNVLYTSLDFVSLFPESFTTSIDDYMNLDPAARATLSSDAVGLFPDDEYYAVWEECDAEYYYRFQSGSTEPMTMDYATILEIVLEKRLLPDQHETEWERIQALFQKIQESKRKDDKDTLVLEEIEIGDYTCLTLYSSAPRFSGRTQNEGNQLIYAYNTKTNMARYVAFYSPYGAKSYYSSLVWYRYES